MTAVGALDIPERRRAMGAAAPGFACRVEVVRGREALEALAPQWAALAASCPEASVFQSPGWARAVFDFEARRGNRAFEPVIAALHDGSRLVALLPLERIRTGARRVLVPLGNAFGQYADCLVMPGYEPRPVVAQLLAAAIGAAPADAVSFLKVRDGSALARGLPDRRIPTGTAEGAPYVALDAFADFPAYFQTIKAKTRKNMRNARNRLEREAPLEHRLAQGPAETLEVIASTLSGRAERLKDQGLTSRAFRDAGFSAFCESLPGRDDLSLMAFSLLHGGRPIARQWGFVHAGRYYAFVASRDFSNSDESPGKLHLGEVIRVCAEHGLAGCDLGVPAMPYKLTWATDAVTVHDYALPVTIKGWLLIQLWDVRIRPALKTLLMRMPAGLRARALRLVGHGH